MVFTYHNKSLLTTKQLRNALNVNSNASFAKVIITVQLVFLDIFSALTRLRKLVNVYPHAKRGNMPIKYPELVSIARLLVRHV